MKRWYKQYFNIHPTGVCLQCKSRADDIFCDIKCSVIWEKDNNINEIQELRKELGWRTRDYKYKKTDDKLNRLDGLALKIKTLVDKVKL